MEYVATTNIEFSHSRDPRSVVPAASVKIRCGQTFDPDVLGIPADEIEHWLARGTILTPEQWQAEQERALTHTGALRTSYRPPYIRKE